MHKKPIYFLGENCDVTTTPKVLVISTMICIRVKMVNKLTTSVGKVDKCGKLGVQTGNLYYHVVLPAGLFW